MELNLFHHEADVLKYCAWCDLYQGVAPGEGHQIRDNVCEIDTSTICPECLERLVGELMRERYLSI